MAMTNNDGLRDAIGALERAGFAGIRTITWDDSIRARWWIRHQQSSFWLPPARLVGRSSGVDSGLVGAVGQARLTVTQQ